MNTFVKWSLYKIWFLYFSDCKVTEPEPAAKDEEVSKELWNVSCTIVNLDPQYNPFKSAGEV